MSIVVKKHNPTSPGRRGLITVRDDSLYKGRPYHKLITAKKNAAGRNNLGRITHKHLGGGHKKILRHIDWNRNKDNIAANVVRIEYDPNRSSYLALLRYADGEYRYIIYAKGLKIGSQVISGPQSAIAVGNCLPLVNIPDGTLVHNLELIPGKGAKLVRSAGCYAQILAKHNKYATIRLQSGEIRKILVSCRASIGEIGKSEHSLIKLGKAGRKRWLKKRPHVRGVAMNPIDHPMGGGEGRTSGGRPSCNAYGLAEGTRTRKVKKHSNIYIIKRRVNKKRKK